jgi:hypothetical protein
MKCLFQGAAATFEDAIRAWKSNGEESVCAVIRDIDRLLLGDYSPSEFDEFVDQHSDYGEEGGGRATLEFIKNVLNEKSCNSN